MRPHSFTTATPLFLAFVVLHGCGVTNETSSSPGEKEPQMISKQKRDEDRAAFENMAPPGWSLQKSDNDGVASYLVSIPQKSSSSKIVAVSAAITLDGRNEPMVRLGTAIPHWTGERRQDRETALSLFADFNEYEKDVAVRSTGYDLKRRTDIRGVAYYNFAKAISCYGHVPKQFECYWGTPSKRMSLYFHSDDLDVVLPYVLSMQGGT